VRCIEAKGRKNLLESVGRCVLRVHEVEGSEYQ
jgi:hypothetical protein